MSYLRILVLVRIIGVSVWHVGGVIIKADELLRSVLTVFEVWKRAGTVNVWSSTEYSVSCCRLAITSIV